MPGSQSGGDGLLKETGDQKLLLQGHKMPASMSLWKQLESKEAGGGMMLVPGSMAKVGGVKDALFGDKYSEDLTGIHV